MIQTKDGGRTKTMIDHPLYGPLFDPEDGTVGRIQLNKRWALTSLRTVWPQPRAVFMYDSPEVAAKHLTLLKDTAQPIPLDLEVAAWWCWPTSRCPAYRAKKEVVCTLEND